VIETSRIILRRLVLTDADALTSALSDPEIKRFLPHLATSAGVQTWILTNLVRYEQDGIGKWAMLLKPNHTLIGYAGLATVRLDGVIETESGYALAPQYRGQGFATEGSQACIAYAFERLGRNRVISLINEQNYASRRVGERNGMTIEKETIYEGKPYLVYVISR
jgi:RimJ/RimL family protein N-acetyltransferase